MTYVRTDILAHSTDYFGAYTDILCIQVRLRDRPLDIVNVYNSGTGSHQTNEAAEPLINATLSPTYLVVGDFNLHHPRWDARVLQSTRNADMLADWLLDSNSVLLADPNIPTHDAGGVLDLSIISHNIPSTFHAQAILDEALTCGNNHSAVVVTISRCEVARRRPTNKVNMKSLDQKGFERECSSLAAHLQATYPNLSALPTEQKHLELDNLAAQLQQGISDVLTKSTTKSSNKGRGNPWWNSSCKEAAIQHRKVRKRWKKRREDPVRRNALKRAKKRLRKAARNAKRKFFKSLIAELKDAKDLFRAVKWAHKPLPLTSPPLKAPDGREITAPTDKTQLLRDTHVPEQAVSDDHPLPFVRATDPLDSFTEKEIRDAMWKPKNTAPRVDNIPNAALKLTWPSLKDIYVKFFHGCIRWGHHPASFKHSAMVVLPKPGDRDMSSPRSYRLISLLPTLGKALERLIAKRLSYVAVERSIIPPRYTSALPKRSVTDLILSLYDELEEAKNQGRSTSIFTFDIKGAFDSVTPNRMVNRLISQGWPASICRWTASFLSGRTSTISLDGFHDQPTPLGGSLPQGSPISPILFLLFMAPLYERVPTALGYADDGCLVAKSLTLRENAALLKMDLEVAQSWCSGNGLSLDWAKSGYIHITHKRNMGNPEVILPNGQSLAPVGVNEPLRWLGVLLHRKQSPRPQVALAVRKAQKAISGIRMLSGVYKGAPTEFLTHAVRACVIPILTFAAVAWWPLRTRRRQIVHLESQLGKTLRAALRAALPVYCTTSTALLHHAAKIPTMELILDDLHHREAIRLATLDPNHMIVRDKRDARVNALRRLLPKSIPQASYLYDKTAISPYPGSLPFADKEEEVQRHAERRSRCPDDIWAYSDGSMLASGFTGAGWVVGYPEDTLAGSIPTGKWNEVADAEAIAALHALECAEVEYAGQSKTLHRCLDNRSVVDRILNPTTKIGTSQNQIDSVKSKLRNWHTHRPGCTAYVHWVPGHMGVQGNEAADERAKGGAARDHAETEFMSLARAQRWRKTWLQEGSDKWWNTQKKPSHLTHQLDAPKLWKHEYKSFGRQTVGRVLSARSAHGDFAQYHRRFAHEDAELLCPDCNEEKSAFHAWTCAHVARPFQERFIQKLIVSEKGFRALAKKLTPSATQAE
ncbi:uncharacterized protein BROUX77_005346 [Berkeleyomyces rouxiae]|uniref:uncharacterized protein n=1 Tax=Berkeleyomyces rouxiae TaxID=2035830 RepID=UPI003B7E5750